MPRARFCPWAAPPKRPAPTPRCPGANRPRLCELRHRPTQGQSGWTLLMVQVGYWLEPSTSRVKPMGKWLISLQNTMRGIVDIGCIAVESLLAELVVVLLLVLLESEPPPVFDGP